MTAIAAVQLVVGLEVHVELATRSKAFSRAPNPAHPDLQAPPPNSLIDPTVLALPGALPVLNQHAVELAVRVGLALNCRIAPLARWDRKSYFYPDMPKAYQISQYDLPLCFDGAFDLPPTDPQGLPIPDALPTRIAIQRAHLEEDAGKLLHEAPGGLPIPHSIVDYNRAGTPLLEIVTQPDFSSADQVVFFAKSLRTLCRSLGATQGVMQKGHIRFEPNINCILTLDSGHTVKTPIVEIKNLNSFRALKDAIDFEHREQPKRFLADGRVHASGAKTTRGWDDLAHATVLQREKEDAHDYRYFPDPDLPPVAVPADWVDAQRAALPELPLARLRRYTRDYALGAKEALTLAEERDDADFFDAAVDALAAAGADRPRAGKLVANILLQSASRRANERQSTLAALGLSPRRLAALASLRDQSLINNQSLDLLFDALLLDPAPAREPFTDALARAQHLAAQHGWLVSNDAAALDAWVDHAIATHPKAADDVRAGKPQAVGRLVGEAMKAAQGAADAQALRDAILKKLAP